MLSNLLERRAFFGQTQGSAPTSTQLEINQLSDGFASSASDWKALASMSLGGFAFKLGKLATMGGLSSQVIGTGAGLLAEVAAFRSSEALLRGQGIENAFEGKGFAATVLNFGLLKGVGSAFRSQNQIFIHTFQSGAMVVGHEWGARLSLVDAPSGTLVQQWIHAELMNIQMQAGAALVHATLPGLAMKERELGLRLETMVGASRWLAQGQGIASPLQQGKILPLMANENPLAPKPEEVVEIQGGRFVMGSRGPDSLKNEIPHLVELSPFRILRTPVTNAILFQHLGKYYSTPFAMIGRDQAGIWRVV